MESQIKKLYRSRQDRVIAGICGGLGEYFNIDSAIFRILFLILTFGGGFGLLLYIILILLIPNRPTDFVEESNESKDNVSEFNKAEIKEKAKEFGQQMKENVQKFVTEMKEMRSNHDHNRFRNILGVFIVTLGVFLLANNMLPHGWVRWDLFWPVVIIVLGIIIVTKK